MNILACSGQDDCYPTGRKHSIWLHADKEQGNIIIRSIIFFIYVKILPELFIANFMPCVDMLGS